MKPTVTCPKRCINERLLNSCFRLGLEWTTQPIQQMAIDAFSVWWRAKGLYREAKDIDLLLTEGAVIKTSYFVVHLAY